MNEQGRRLGLREFFGDIKQVLVSPARRFPVIVEREALWGSLLLLIAPAYFSYHFVGAVYFRRDPFPGYSFIIPAIVAAAYQLLAVFCIHIFARLFSRGTHLPSQGRFRRLLTVYGYTTLPATLALIFASLIFFAFSRHIISLFREYRAVGISLFIAFGIALFLWNIVLLVLAMRSVYVIRDFKIIISFLLGTVLLGVLQPASSNLWTPANISYINLQPILSKSLIGMISTDPAEGADKENKVRISLHIDVLSYRFKMPQRSELVTFLAAGEQLPKRGGWFASRPWPRKDLRVGRIIGMPGETITLAGGTLLVNGRKWAEPYITPEFRSSASLPPQQLGSSQYLILSDNRRLIDSSSADVVINRDRILGRCAINRFPLGWLIFRPEAFLQALPLE